MQGIVGLTWLSYYITVCTSQPEWVCPLPPSTSIRNTENHTDMHICTLNNNCLGVIHTPIPIDTSDDSPTFRSKCESRSKVPTNHSHWLCSEVPWHHFITRWYQSDFTTRKTPDDCCGWESTLVDHFNSRAWQARWGILHQAQLTVGWETVSANVLKTMLDKYLSSRCTQADFMLWDQEVTTKSNLPKSLKFRTLIFRRLSLHN